MTINDTYVTAEIAELLRNKGFDIPCRTFYNKGKFKRDTCQLNHNAGIHLSAPSTQMTMQWLRTVHAIEIVISVGLAGPDCKLTYYWNVVVCKANSLEYPISYPDGSVETPAETWEEAANAAFKYCLTKIL